MRIDSFQILSYKSYFDSEEIPLAPGMNIVVGANSVGKSALLEALSLRFKVNPHRSRRSIPHPEDPESPQSSVIAEVSCSGAELRRTFLRSGATVFLPWRAGLKEDATIARAIIDEVFQSSQFTARICAMAPRERAAGVDAASNSTISWDGKPYTGPWGQHDAAIAPDSNRRDIGNIAFGKGGRSLSTLAAETVLPRVFRFQAERLNVGQSKSGQETRLLPDASNLPEVLHNLQGNPDRFAEYEALVQRVFPVVDAITLKPGADNTVEIRIWQLPRKSQRADLAFPLNQCGTGLGQVLALLYVVVSSPDPQIILIDEPNSFLHPAAARELIRVLLAFPQHQYVIATHAPEVISEAGACPVLRIEWRDEASQCTAFSERTTEVSRSLLTDVGARLSDVFGFDHVLWVEGPSDQACIRVLTETEFQPIKGLAILPVRDTGNFERRRAGDIVAIYRQASMGSALLPPTVGFLLDRDGRTQKEIQEVGEETSGAVTFLERRMLENYLLQPEAIHAVLATELSDNAPPELSAAAVKQWLHQHGNDPAYGMTNASPFSDPWMQGVHGGKLLHDLFSGLSNQRLEFRKTRHCKEIVCAILKVQPRHLGPLAEEVMAKISAKRKGTVHT